MKAEVPPAAVDAAADLTYAGRQLTAARAKAVLDCAAPHIAAAALQMAAAQHQPEGKVLGAPCVVCRSTGWPCHAAVHLRSLAHELVPATEDTPEAILAVLGDGDPELGARRHAEYLTRMAPTVATLKEITKKLAPYRLTPREREVLELLVPGLSNREIAERLGMSESTASVHVSKVIGKLGVTNRTQAATCGRAFGVGGLATLELEDSDV